MKLLALSVLVLFSFSLSAGEWITLTRNGGLSAQRVIVSDDDPELVVDFKVPGFQIEKTMIDGKEYSSLNLEGTAVSLERGAPELRSISAFIAVPACVKVEAEIRNSQFKVMDSSPIVPSKGNIMRNIDPDMVGYSFGKAYETRGYFPTDNNLVQVSAPFLMRDVWGVRVTFTPFQYNHQEGKLKVYENVRIALKPMGAMKSSISKAAHSSDFNKLYKDVFLNLQQSKKSLREVDPETVAEDSEANMTVPQEAKKLLIIAHDSFVDACNPLKEWKTQQGYAVDLVKLSDIGTTADQIKAYLQQRYDAGNLCFVTLVGDSQHIPTLKGLNERADSDPCYVKLAGNDNVMDAFICRISGESATGIEYIVQKTIHYEQYPMQGADGDWYKNTLAIASAQGSPKDFERTDVLNKALADSLGFTATTCYDTTSYGGADKSIIPKAVNEGTNIINYCGHGSTTSWGTSGFSNTDCGNLTNGMKLPVIWSVACVNGQFVGKTCFAEAWLRAGTKDAPAGCIGIAAASTNMAWVPPCVWQKEIIVEQSCKKLHDLFIVQHAYGILKTMEEYGVTDSSEGNQLSEQTHYFGEGTVAIRTAARNVQADSSLNRGELTVKVNGGAGLTVSAYNDKYENVIVAVTNSNGEATLPINGQTLYSVTGSSIVPVIDNEI
ncbi:MAG: C25 family cysteine peptidase [Candidatus Wallbacteria bacterium]|nr:C25 family cysteine peptidase [Candidatus Wallbacteria bacterium]